MSSRKILVAHDFSAAATRALQFAAGVATQLGASLDVAYVQPAPYDGRGDPSLSFPDALPGEPERYLRFLEKELAALTRDALGNTDLAIQYHAVRGDPVKRLEALAAELGADTLCLGATGKGAVARMLLGSVSLLALRSATLPVLLVP